VKTFARAFIGEYRRIFGDIGAFLVLVAAIVFYAFFYPTPYTTEVLKEVPVVAVNLDQSDMSRRLVRMVDAHELIRISAEAGSLAEAEAMVRSGAAGAILVVPAQFEKKIRRGEQASVALYSDAAYILVYRQALTGAMEAVGTLSAGIEIRRLQAQGLPFDAAAASREPVGLVTRPLFNAAEGYATYVVPAVLVLILQQTLLIGIGLVGGTSREQRRKGAAVASERPATRPAALPTVLGRALAYFLLYLVHLVFYFGIVFHVFGFPQRAAAIDLLRFATPFLLSAIFLALGTRTLFRTREMSMQVLLFTSLPAVFLAGFTWPVESMPRWLATFARVLPSTSAIPGFLRLSEMGATLQQVRTEWLFLWALCGVYFVFAWAAEWWELGSTGK
jgi:ABC-2 type transport system permease protein